MPKRSRQIILPTSRIYMERERIRQMEISAPMPISALQELRACQTTGERNPKTNQHKVMQTPALSENKEMLNATKTTVENVAQTGDILLAHTFRDRVLPELTIKLQQHTSNNSKENAYVKHYTADGNVEMLFSNLYEIPPAAETWRRSDCFSDNGELGWTSKVEKNLRSGTQQQLNSLQH